MWFSAAVIEVPSRVSYELLDRDDAGERLLVLVHGYGLPSSELTDRVDMIDPKRRCTVAVPQAPFEHRGLRIWHRAGHTAAEIAMEQYLASVRLLDDLLGELETGSGLSAEDAVVGGFSQGGGISLSLLFADGVEHRPAAAFGICSFPPSFEGFAVEPGAAAGRPAFLTSAHRDRFAPIEASRAGAAAFAELGLDLTYTEADSEHVMTDEAALQVGTWLHTVMDGSPDGDASARTRSMLAGVDGSGFFGGRWAHSD